jgi:hypothetical protein
VIEYRAQKRLLDQANKRRLKKDKPKLLNQKVNNQPIVPDSLMEEETAGPGIEMRIV